MNHEQRFGTLYLFDLMNKWPSCINSLYCCSKYGVDPPCVNSDKGSDEVTEETRCLLKDMITTDSKYFHIQVRANFRLI